MENFGGAFDDEEQNTEDNNVKESKIERAPDLKAWFQKSLGASRVGGGSPFGKSEGSIPNDIKSTQKSSGNSYDAAATTSKEAAKSKEDKETLKTSSKETVNKSKGKTPPSSDRVDTNGDKMEYDKEKEEKKLNLEEKRLRLKAKKLRIEAEKEQSKIRQEDERLRLEDEKMKLLKKESDHRIMMMDVSVMTEMQRLYFEKLQKEIIMRCDHG